MIRTYLNKRSEELQMHRISRLGTDITLLTDVIGEKKSTTSYQIDSHIKHTQDVKDSVLQYFMKKNDLEPIVLEKLMELQEMKISTLLDCRRVGEKILDVVLYPTTRFRFIYLGTLKLTFMELMVLSLSITLIYCFLY